MKKCNQLLITIIFVIFIGIYAFTILSNIGSLLGLMILLPILFGIGKLIHHRENKMEDTELGSSIFSSFTIYIRFFDSLYCFTHFKN